MMKARLIVLLAALEIATLASTGARAEAPPAGASAAGPARGDRWASSETAFPPWVGELQSEVVALTRGFDGELMLWIKDLQTGTRYEHNSATPAYIASGVKILFMVELFRQASRGKLSIDEEIDYTEEDVRDGSPVLNFVRVGSKVPIRVLLEAMIQQSDNAASDMIVQRLGIAQINAGIAELGFKGFGPVTSLIEVRRLLYRFLDPRIAMLPSSALRAVGQSGSQEDKVLRLADLLGELPGTFTKPDLERAYRLYYRSGVNTAPLEAVGALLEALVQGKVVSPSASRAMIDVMLGTLTGERRIPALLPPGTPVAHKTGTQYERICDLAIIYLPGDRPVVMAACTKGGSQRRAEDVIAGVARKTYDLLTGGAIAARPAKTSTLAGVKERDEDEDDVKAPKKKKKKKKKGEAGGVLPNPLANE